MTFPKIDHTDDHDLLIKGERACDILQRSINWKPHPVKHQTWRTGAIRQRPSELEILPSAHCAHYMWVKTDISDLNRSKNSRGCNHHRIHQAQLKCWDTYSRGEHSCSEFTRPNAHFIDPFTLSVRQELSNTKHIIHCLGNAGWQFKHIKVKILRLKVWCWSIGLRFCADSVFYINQWCTIYYWWIQHAAIFAEIKLLSGKHSFTMSSHCVSLYLGQIIQYQCKDNEHGPLIKQMCYGSC